MSKRMAMNGFCSRWHFSVFGLPFKAHLHYFWQLSHLLFVSRTTNKLFFHNDHWSDHRIMITQICSKITTLTTCQIWDFQAPLESSFQIIFLVILPMIKCYKTNKRTKFLYDLMKILGIMAVQIWLRMSILLFFGSYPYFEFLPWLQILNTNILMYPITHSHS